MREADKRMYYIVSPNSFAYNPARINVGSIGYQNIGKNVIVSSLYEVFKTSEDVDDRLLWHWFKSPDFQKLIMQLQEGGVRLYFYYDKLCMGEVSLPSLEEQRKIGKLFDTLDNLITLHQRQPFLHSTPDISLSVRLIHPFYTSSWEQRKVGEVSESYSGGTPSVGVKEYYGGQIPFIRSAEINSEITELFLTEEGLKNSSARLVAVGDILYALYGATSGEVGRARLKGAINQAILAIKPHTDYDSEYLAQWLRKSKHSIIETYLQGGQGNLSGTIVKELSVDFPSLKEQKAIGDFFRQLDNLITLHQRKCVFLFGFFQAFISMIFTASTFSWEQRKLGEMGQTYTGLSGKTKDDFGHGQARFVTYMNVFSNPISNPEMTEPIEIDPKQNEVEVGDVFFTTSSETPEEVGMSSILLEKRGKTYLNSFCFGFRPSEKIDSYYLAYMLRSDSARAKIILLAQGISRYNISKNKVMEIAVSLPSLDEQKMIGQYFSQLDNLITLHQRKPFIMKWRTSDANRNQTIRLVL